MHPVGLSSCLGGLCFFGFDQICHFLLACDLSNISKKSFRIFCLHFEKIA